MAAKRTAKERVQNYPSLFPELEIELLEVDISELELDIPELELDIPELENLSLWEGSLNTYN